MFNPKVLQQHLLNNLKEYIEIDGAENQQVKHILIMQNI